MPVGHHGPIGVFFPTLNHPGVIELDIKAVFSHENWSKQAIFWTLHSGEDDKFGNFFHWPTEEVFQGDLQREIV